MSISWIKAGLLCGVIVLGGTTTGISADNVTPTIEKNGIEPPSRAVRTIVGLIPWLNDGDLRAKIIDGMKAKDKDVSSLLSGSGQAGVAVQIDIKHDAVERDGKFIDVDRLLNNEVKLLGAGSSLNDIFLAVSLKDQDRIFQANDRIDGARSFFVWFTKTNGQTTSLCLSQDPIRYATSRKVGDKVLEKIQAEQLFASGLQSAVSFLEKTTKDKEVQKQLKDWRDEQEATNRKVEQINQDLKDERERLARAQNISDQFSMMANVLSFASQAQTMKSQLGKDAPASIDSAKTSGELLTIIQKIVVERTGNTERMETDITTIQGARVDRERKVLEIVKKPGIYPADRVPQLQVPVLP